jgi:hypothetical protein
MKSSRRFARRGATAGAAPATEWQDVQIRIGAEAGDLSSSARRQAAIALMLATAMQAFDATIANVALPSLAASAARRLTSPNRCARASLILPNPLSQKP